MSRAWRENGRLHIECGECSSVGATHGETQLTRDPEAQSRHDDHVTKMKVVHLENEANYHAAVQAFQNKQIDQKVLGERLQKHITDYTAKVEALVALAPRERDGVTETLAACPWCGASLNVPVTVTQADTQEATLGHAPQQAPPSTSDRG